MSALWHFPEETLEGRWKSLLRDSQQRDTRSNFSSLMLKSTLRGLAVRSSSAQPLRWTNLVIDLPSSLQIDCTGKEATSHALQFIEINYWLLILRSFHLHQKRSDPRSKGSSMYWWRFQLSCSHFEPRNFSVRAGSMSYYETEIDIMMLAKSMQGNWNTRLISNEPIISCSSSYPNLRWPRFGL